MADNTTVSNSIFSNNPDIQVRTTAPTAGTGANKHIQHVAVEGVYKARVDVVSASEEYYGLAVPGTAEGTAGWRIIKKTVSGAITSYDLADGNPNFDNIWTNRASLSYL